MEVTARCFLILATCGAMACAAGRAGAAPGEDRAAARQAVQFGVPMFRGAGDDAGQPPDPVETLPRASREVQRRLLLAERACREGRYNEAAAALQDLLEEDAEDGFLSSRSGQAAARTVRHEAHRLLAEMPSQGRQWYEVQFGGLARVLLVEAVRQGDPAKLAQVSRAYLHTEAGCEATLLLARHCLDLGRPLEAVLWLSRLGRSPAAPDRCEPECSFLTATCWLLEGNPQAAQEALAALRQRAPGAKVRIAHRELHAARDAEELFRLLSAACSPRAGGVAAAESWLTPRGNAARSAQSDWGGTIGERSWSAPLADDPADVELLRMSASAWPASGVPPGPALHTIVAGDTVLTRTPYRLVAIERETGRRVWEFPWDSLQERGPRRTASRRTLSTRNQDLEQRTWHEALYGQPVSDGRRAYLLDRLETGAGGPYSQVLMGGRQVVLRAAGFGANEPANRLIALDLAREGAMAWAVGGHSGEEEPRLAGAYFLGAPVVDGPRLYLLAELKHEIALCALDSASGRLEWTQTIAHPRGNHAETAMRRQTGVSPSLAGGVLVCPTSAGAVVAVDPATRSLLWGYAYQRSEEFSPRSVRWPGRVVSAASASRNLRPDASATIAEGRVLATPADSDLAYCLDLFTGEEIWSCQREGAILVACVYGGKAVLVGPREVTALRMADRAPAWQPAKLLLPSEALPSGRGLHCGRHYYLPTTAKELLKIDLDTGRIETSIKTPAVLGNLVGLRGRLLSHSAEGVEQFEAGPRDPR